MTILLRQKPLPQVVRQIVQRDNGAWFDPSDLSTLFQDAAGTTPVTAVEQPVGKILDKSGNGNHATQSITASRPVLSARYNLLTKTEDFSDEKWVKNGCTISSNVAQAPNGTISADKMVIRSGTWPTAQVSNSATVGGSIPVIAKVTMKAGEKSIGYIQCNSEGGSVVSTCVMFNLSTGTKGSLITIAGAGLINPIAGITPLSNGFYECSLSFTTNATAGPVYVLPGFCDSMSSRSVVGDGVGGAYIFSADLRIGTSGPYQRVNTATDYDTDERYFPKYLKFDGVDDYMTLGDVFDIGIEGVSIATSVILFNATTSPIAGKSRAAGEGGRYFLGGEPSSFLFASHDTTSRTDIGLAATIGVNTLFTAKLGPHGARYLSLYKNAALINSIGTPLTTSSYDTNNPFWIGAYPNSSGTTPAYGYLNGGIYGLIITKSALTDAQRIACERHLGRKAGVPL